MMPRDNTRKHHLNGVHTPTLSLSFGPIHTKGTIGHALALVDIEGCVQEVRRTNFDGMTGETRKGRDATRVEVIHQQRLTL